MNREIISVQTTRGRGRGSFPAATGVSGPDGRRFRSLAPSCAGFSAAVVIAFGWAALAAVPAAAQTDYYNIDSGRPVRIEDAYPVERYAFEAQVAPLRMERRDDGAYHWEFEPELGYGI